MDNRIKELRKAQNLTLEALADLTGISAQQINRLEKKQRRLNQDNLQVLAKALNVAPEDIISKDYELEAATPNRRNTKSDDVVLPTFVFGICMDAIIKNKRRLNEEFQKAFYQNVLRRAQDEVQLYKATRLTEKEALQILRDMIDESPESAGIQ